MVNDQTVEVVHVRTHQNVHALTKKTKSEIGLHHGIFLCQPLGQMQNNIITKIMIALITLMHYLTLA